MGRSWNPPKTLPSVSVISKSAVKFIKYCDSPFVRLDMIGLYENPTGSEYNTISSPGSNVFDTRSSYTPYPPTDSGTTNKSSEKANVPLEVMTSCPVVALPLSVCADDD